MIIQPRRTFWILIPLATTAFVFLTRFNTTIIDQGVQETKIFQKTVKKIVAYSLLKRIEIESEQYTCGFNNNSSAINESVIISNYTPSEWNYEDYNNVWMNIDGTGFYVFSAHMDKRLDPYRYIRIIAMVKGTSQETTHCQFSFSNRILATKVTATPIWLDIWDQNDTNIYFNPVLLSCRVPYGLPVTTFYLVPKPCTNVQGKKLVITNNRRNRKYNFTVCVKPLDFLEDITERLIQWIEICRILGAEKIEIYVKNIKKKVWRILKWYSSTYPNEITIKKFKVLREQKAPDANTSQSFSRILWQKRRYEVVTYNSCFYRNMENSDFIIPLDIDEVIVPQNVFTWKDFVNDIDSVIGTEERFASFMVPNAYFLGQQTSRSRNKFFFLENVYRTQFSPSGESGKSFISTKDSLTIFNHYTLDVLRPGVNRTFFLPASIAQLNHYKESCNSVILPECVKYVSSRRVRDFTILKYRKVFMNNYRKSVSMLKALGFLLSQ